MEITQKFTKVVYSAMIAALLLGTMFVSGVNKAAAAAWDYQLISQSSYPSSLAAGATTNVWIEVKNTGTSTWSNTGATPVRLGAGSKYGAANQQRDYSSEFYDSATWLSSNRAAAILHPEVRAGWHTRFQFNIKAPMTNGTYKAYFTPVVDGLAWLRDIGIFWQLTVGDGTMPTQPTDPTQPTQPTDPGVVEGALTASIASTNPASATLVAGQATANLAEFSFMGTGTVTALQLKRIGVSADDTLSNIYLFDGPTRLTDAATVSSNGVVNFTGNLFTVSGSKTISVKSDIKAATQGQTVGAQLTSYTVGTSAATTASLSGNLHTIANATLADTTFTAPSPTGGNIDPANDVVVWQSTATVSQRDVMLKRMALRQIGSINSGDIRNFRLLVDGQQVASTAALDSNGYVTFALTTPKNLITGGRVIKVLADVVGGSNRTFQFSLRQKGDIDLVDSSFNVNIASSSTFPLSATAVTVTQGTLTVQKTSDSVSGNVTLNASDVSLGKYTFTAYGEPIKVETLTAGFTYVDGDVVDDNAAATLRNGRIMVNGAQVGSTTTIAAAGTSFTTNFIVSPGTPVTVEIRSDIFDNDGAGAGIEATDTIQAQLNTGSSNATRQVSLGSINVPSSATAANQVTVASAAAITLVKQANYPDQSTTVPQTAAYKFASYNVTGSSTEDVNIDTVTLQVNDTNGGASTFDFDDLTDIYVKVNGVQSTIKPTLSAGDNTYSIAFTLAKNVTIPVEVWAKIGSDITIAAAPNVRKAQATLTLSGTTALSTVASSTGAVTGQVISAVSGVFNATVDASTPDARLLDDAGTVVASAFKLESLNESSTVTDITVKFGTGAGTAPTTVGTVTLKDGSTVIGTNAAAALVTFSGLNFVIPANGSKVLTVETQITPVGTGAGTSGQAIQVLIDQYKYLNSQGQSTTVGDLGAGVTDVTPSQVNYVYKSIPTITNVGISTILSTGTQVLSKFSVSSGGTGTISWKKLAFDVTKTDTATGVQITNAELWNADTNTLVVAAANCTITTLAFTDAAGSIVCELPTTGEEQISGTRIYELRASIASDLAVGNNVNTRILQPSSFVAPTDYATVDAAATFIWSDQSAQGHSTTTTDWSNGFLVKNLPTSTQSLVK